MQQLEALQVSLQKIHMPALRYDSTLLERLPAGTVVLRQHSEPGSVSRRGADRVPPEAGGEPRTARLVGRPRSSNVEPVLEKLRAASEYLGDEMVVAAVAGADGGMDAPVFLAESRREGFAEFLKQQGIPAAVVTRPGLVVFGPAKASVESMAAALDSASGSFQGTPFYARIADAYRTGAGLLLCADLSRLHAGPQTAGVRYFVAEQKEVKDQMETRAAVDFDGPRTGIAAWLADPSPDGLARLRFARCHPRGGVRGEEPGGHRRRSGRRAAALSGGCPAGARRAPAEGRVRCPQRPRSEPGRRVFPLARRPALPGALLEAGGRSLRSGALAGDPAEVRRGVQPARPSRPGTRPCARRRRPWKAAPTT